MERSEENDEVREFAQTLGVTDLAFELPRENEYRVMAARPMRQTEPVTPPIKGYYHAHYALDKITDEKGHFGVSFHIEQVNE